MDKIRLFIGIKIPEDLGQDLQSLEDELKKANARVKWVNAKDLHLTLKFLGAIPEERVSEIAASLKSAAIDTPTFLLGLKGVGAFPRRGNPRVVWVGAGEGRKEIIALQERVEGPFEKLGFPREAREYTPHLTIGRVKGPVNADELRGLIGKKSDIEFGKIPVHEVAIIKSDLGLEGPAYTILQKIQLKTKGEIDG